MPSLCSEHLFLKVQLCAGTCHRCLQLHLLLLLRAVAAVAVACWTRPPSKTTPTEAVRTATFRRT